MSKYETAANQARELLVETGIYLRNLRPPWKGSPRLGLLIYQDEQANSKNFLQIKAAEPPYKPLLPRGKTMSWRRFCLSRQVAD